MVDLKLRRCAGPCGQEKDVSEFGSGHKGKWCKLCYNGECRENERKRILKDPNYRGKRADRQRERRAKDPSIQETLNARKRERRKEDPEYRKKEQEKENQRARLRRANDREWREKSNAKDRSRGPSKVARRTERYRNDPEYRKKVSEYRYKNQYGLTPEIEKEILERQNHRCPICTRKFSKEIRMVRDHDHTLEHFRGFLCSGCNTMIGFAEATGDAETTLVNAIKMVRDNSLFMSVKNS